MNEAISTTSDITLLNHGKIGLASSKQEGFFLLPTVDFNELFQQKDYISKIKEISPQHLYLSLLQDASENSLEVLKHITQEQFKRIFDYDVWLDKSIHYKRAYFWLRKYKEISHQELFKRVRQLDEEYLYLLFGTFCRLYSKEEFDSLDDETQNNLAPFPGEKLFYSIEVFDEELRLEIFQVIESLLTQDIQYVISLLSVASSHQLFNEVEYNLERFRQARLEEDGFLTTQESHSYFLPKKIVINKEVTDFDDSKIINFCDDTKNPFLNKVLDLISKKDPEAYNSALTKIFHLVNATCAISNVEASDNAQIKNLFKQACALISLSLDDLSKHNTDFACTVLSTQSAKSLCQHSVYLMDHLRQNFLNQLEKTNFKEVGKLKKFLKQMKYGLLLDILDKKLLTFISMEKLEILKALFNRYPMYPEQLISKDSSLKKTFFKNISCLKEYNILSSHIYSLGLQIEICSLASKENKLSIDTPLDEYLFRLILSYSSNKKSSINPLSKNEIENIYKKHKINFCDTISQLILNLQAYLSEYKIFSTLDQSYQSLEKDILDIISSDFNDLISYRENSNTL